MILDKGFHSRRRELGGGTYTKEIDQSKTKPSKTSNPITQCPASGAVRMGCDLHRNEAASLLGPRGFNSHGYPCDHSAHCGYILSEMFCFLASLISWSLHGSPAALPQLRVRALSSPGPLAVQHMASTLSCGIWVKTTVSLVCLSIKLMP